MKTRSRRLDGLAQSPIRTMTRLCSEQGGINLGQGLCQMPTPSVVIAAASEAMKADHNAYSYPEGELSLRKLIAAKLLASNQIQADPMSEITVTSGTAAAFTATIHGLLEPGDGILLFEPYYGYHLAAAKVAGLQPEFVTLQGPGFALNEETLRAAISPKTRAMVLVTPGNPTGHMMTRGELEIVERVAEEFDLLVITDEIYEEIRYDGREHISPATVGDLGKRTVTLMGLSKTFAITGWRLGYAVAPPELSKAITLVHDLFYICAPTPLQHGVAAGFQLPPSFFEEQRQQYAARRSLLCDALDRAGLPAIRPEGAYYVLSDVSRLGQPDSMACAVELLERTGVATVPGSAFHQGAGGDQQVRLCFALPMESIEEAAERLGRL
jgi:aminotransferase